MFPVSLHNLLISTLISLFVHRGLSSPAVFKGAQWSSVERGSFAGDTIYLPSCMQSCSLFMGSVPLNHSSAGECSCQCTDATPVFLPSTRHCVSKLGGCSHIAFRVDDRYSRSIPTLSLPSTNKIFAPLKPILWRESLINVSVKGDVNCHLKAAFVLLDDVWMQRNHSELFYLAAYVNSTYLVWRGNELDARQLEGALVQLEVECDANRSTQYCLVFRIAGVHVNLRPSPISEKQQGRHVELIACILMAILLVITVVASVTLWTVCWRVKKGKLIAKMQLQFLYHMKQQQQYMQEQLAAMKASCAHHAHPLGSDHLSCAVGQRRKLYFSSEFFESEQMAHPPELARQFVVELRKMIEVAKDRIRLKRHVPTLDAIGEEQELADEFLEIPTHTEAYNRNEEPSPKSAKSADSGCDSMSDEDTQPQSTEGNSAQTVPSHQPPSRIPVVTQMARNLCRKTEPPAVPAPSRIPTIASSRMVSPMTPSPRLPPRNASNGVVSTSELPLGERSGNSSAAVPSQPSYRSPPNLRRILSSVPPPLPESEPPNTASARSSQENSIERKGYTVFPSESMRKKSLPRRSKRSTPKPAPTTLTESST